MLRIFTFAAALLATSSAFAVCVGTDTFSTCNDSAGNSYTTTRMGNYSTTNGSNGRTGSNWSSSTTNLGSMSMTNGTSSNGNSWNLNQTDLGNGYSTYNGRNSNGDYVSGMCGPMGCQ